MLELFYHNNLYNAIKQECFFDWVLQKQDQIYYNDQQRKENALKNQWELQVKPSKLLTNTKDVTYFDIKFF